MKKINFKKLSGLIPVVIQDYKNKQVRMVGFMNKLAWRKTLATSQVWFYSRTKRRLWRKGETSGNFLEVKKIRLDCDNDSLLIMAKQIGGATCHTGRKSCFFQLIKKGSS